MLAITKESAYRICFIKGNNDCINECSQSDNIIHDVDGNRCGENCDNNKYLIMPEEVCSFKCILTSIYLMTIITVDYVEI